MATLILGDGDIRILDVFDVGEARKANQTKLQPEPEFRRSTWLGSRLHRHLDWGAPVSEPNAASRAALWI